MHHGAYARSGGTGLPCTMGRTLGQVVQVLHASWGVRWVQYHRFSMHHGAYTGSDGIGSPCIMGRTVGQMV